MSVFHEACRLPLVKSRRPCRCAIRPVECSAAVLFHGLRNGFSQSLNCFLGQGSGALLHGLNFFAQLIMECGIVDRSFTDSNLVASPSLRLRQSKRDVGVTVLILLAELVPGGSDHHELPPMNGICGGRCAPNPWQFA